MNVPHTTRLLIALMATVAGLSACAPPGGPALTGTIGSYENQTHVLCTGTPAQLRMVADHDAGIRQVNAYLPSIPFNEVSVDPIAHTRVVEMPTPVAGCVTIALSAFIETGTGPLHYTFTWF